MNTILITKPNIPEDVIQIQEVFYRTWLETYPNEEAGITKEDIEEYYKDRLNPKTIQKRIDALSQLPPNQLFIVAKDGDKVVGVCRIVNRETCNQLQAIYVLSEYQRHGVGNMFWDKGQEFFDKSKDTIVQVATYNKKAISFYEKLGFVDTGKRFTEERHKMPISGALIPEMEMIFIKK
ncbi:GNAT family N-acetyltransferase [Candidatus Nomurabacteria bacterium]|nr:GNAT family N-acetyltransferase [Candidatus Nomurabacteria bacterium]